MATTAFQKISCRYIFVNTCKNTFFVAEADKLAAEMEDPRFDCLAPLPLSCFCLRLCLEKDVLLIILFIRSLLIKRTL